MGRPSQAWTDIASGTPKVDWADAPLTVRAEVERTLGAKVVEARTQPGGFSPSCAARLQLEDGRRAFVKAASEETAPESVSMHRREAEVAALLTDVVQVPRLLAGFEREGWFGLLFEDVDGRHPVLPWHDDELDRVLTGINQLSEALTPSPLPDAPIGEHLRPVFTGWARFRDGRAPADELPESWLSEHLDELVGWEARWAEAARGDTLLHADLRADQILLTDDRVVFVDWPHACVGAAWIDVLLMTPSIAMQGGPGTGEVLHRSGLTRGVPDEAVTAVGVALAGFFLASCLQPPVPGLPTLRAFQRAQGEALLPWLRERLAG